MGKKDACYHKVKARYRVFPSAYASGAIAKCRKVGAANYGTGGKKKSRQKTPRRKGKNSTKKSPSNNKNTAGNKRV